MGQAKNILVQPIDRESAIRAVKRWHYSGTFTLGSQLHLGVFLKRRLEGVMQFGPSMDKRKLQGLVRKTPWNGFLELNRMAFSDRLPRNSESRALGIAMRMLRKHRPDIEWIVSFSDATSCGDGTIYRAAGFLLTGISKNRTVLEAPDGRRFFRISLNNSPAMLEQAKQYLDPEIRKAVNVGTPLRVFYENGFRPLKGFQLRYIYFLNKEARERLTVPEIPFSEIQRVGATMYKGQSPGSIDGDAPASQTGEGGSSPTSGLHSKRRHR